MRGTLGATETMCLIVVSPHSLIQVVKNSFDGDNLYGKSLVMRCATLVHVMKQNAVLIDRITKVTKLRGFIFSPEHVTIIVQGYGQNIGA